VSATLGSGAKDEASRGQCAGDCERFSISRLGGGAGAGQFGENCFACVVFLIFPKAPQCWPSITLAAGGPQKMQIARAERQLQQHDWKMSIELRGMGQRTQLNTHQVGPVLVAGLVATPASVRPCHATSKH